MIKNKVLENKIELIFKLLYFAFTLISFNSFCARKPYISYISYVIVALGILIIINRLTHIKDYLNCRVYLLVAFIFSYVIGSINTMRYGVIENVQAIAWMMIQYFIIFAYDKKKDSELAKREFRMISSFFICYTMLMAIVGLILMIEKYEYYAVVDGMYVIGAGFLFNRLWGCYIDPNYGAVFSLVSIILSLYFFKNSKRPLRAILIVNIMCEYLYICYSDSRTGRLSILVAFTVLIYLLLIKKEELNFRNKSIALKGAKKVLIITIISFLCAALVWGGTKTVKSVTSDIKVSIAKIGAIEQGASEQEADIIADNDRIGRVNREINNGDVSNNRFAIWKSGLCIFRENPIIGISFRNILEYARDEMPEGFIAISGYESMHNFLIDILVSQGILGFVIVAILAFGILKRIIILVPKLKETDYEYFVFMFASLIAIFVSMLTYSEAFYMNTGGAFIFWYFLGYISNYMLVESKET